MKKPIRTACGFCISALLLLMPFEADACRPFGSYAFLEDSVGGIWFTEGDNNAISRLSPDGAVKSFPVPTEGAEPVDLAFDSEGNIWFVEMYGNKVGRLSKDGRIKEYPIPTHHAHPVKMAVDSKGNVWFTEAGSKVGRLGKDGRIKEFALKTGWATSIAIDLKDNVWVAALEPSKDRTDQAKSTGTIGILSADGKWKEALEREGSCPMNITADPMGDIWFSDRCRGTVERMDKKGRLAAFDIDKDGFVQDMSFDKKGNLWFADRMRNRLGRIAGNRIEEFVLPGDNGGSFALIATRGGDIYFSEILNYNLNRRTEEGVFEEHIVVVDKRAGERKVVDGETCFIEYAAKLANKAEVEKERLEELKGGRLKEPGDGSSRLVESRCGLCHDMKRILLSRKTDWTYTVHRMQDYLTARDMPLFSDDEKNAITRYLNTYYSTGREAGTVSETGPSR